MKMLNGALNGIHLTLKHNSLKEGVSQLSKIYKKQEGLVVKNDKPEKRKKAVALLYDPENQAPQVVASGQGAVAERIIEKAKESDVATYEDEGLADTLLKLDIGDMIPRELYGVVAEILVYVDKMDKIKSKMKKVI